MVKNKTTVLILVFKEFLQTSIWPLISVLYAKRYHDFPSKLFCLTVPNNFVGEPFSVSENFWYRKILCFRGLYYDFRISVEIFLSHNAENVRRWTLLSCVSENFRWPKSLWIRRGDYQDFPTKILCLTLPKISVGESFTVALISGSEKVWMRGGGGGYQDFPSKFFRLTVPKKFVGESFRNAINSGIEKC